MINNKDEFYIKIKKRISPSHSARADFKFGRRQ